MFSMLFVFDSYLSDVPVTTTLPRIPIMFSHREGGIVFIIGIRGRWNRLSRSVVHCHTGEDEPDRWNMVVSRPASRAAIFACGRGGNGWPDRIPADPRRRRVPFGPVLLQCADPARSSKSRFSRLRPKTCGGFRVRFARAVLRGTGLQIPARRGGRGRLDLVSRTPLSLVR